MLAVPFFVLFIGLELLALKLLDDGGDERRTARRMGYESKDAAGQLSMGVGSAVINVGSRAAALSATPPCTP